MHLVVLQASESRKSSSFPSPILLIPSVISGILDDWGLKVFLILDADDYVMNYALEAAYDKCVKYDLDCLRFRSFTLDEGSNRFIRNARNDFSHLEDGDYDRLLIPEEDSPLLKISVAPWSGMCRRAFLEEHGCRFNGLRCVNDRSFFNRVITAGGRYMCARDRVTVHRVNQSDSLIGQRLIILTARSNPCESRKRS